MSQNSSFVISSEEISLHDIQRASSNLSFGLCCINHTLRFPPKVSRGCPKTASIYPNRTMVSKNFTVEKAKQLALANLDDVFKMLEWNERNGIRHYRMSSDMFPHYTNPLVESYTLDFAREKLHDLGKLASHLGHRITAHPGQFVQIGAHSPDVFQKSVSELQMHTDIMNAMNISPEEGILCIHGGGTYGDKENTIRRWIDQFDELPMDIQSRLAIEHCEKCYSLADVCYISEQTGIPVIFDNLHYDCYLHLHPYEKVPPAMDLLPEVVEKWNDRGVTPVMHLAEQRIDSRVGKHSDYISRIPNVFFELVRETDTPLHIEVEAKMKELAILKLKSQYCY